MKEKSNCISICVCVKRFSYTGIKIAMDIRFRRWFIWKLITLDHAIAYSVIQTYRQTTQTTVELHFVKLLRSDSWSGLSQLFSSFYSISNRVFRHIHLWFSVAIRFSMRLINKHIIPKTHTFSPHVAEVLSTYSRFRWRITIFNANSSRSLSEYVVRKILKWKCPYNFN